MGKLEIGLYDVFSQATMAASSVAADVYDEHIRSAQEAEQMVGCPNRLLSVDRFLDSRCQSRLSSAW